MNSLKSLKRNVDSEHHISPPISKIAIHRSASNIKTKPVADRNLKQNVLRNNTIQAHDKRVLHLNNNGFENNGINESSNSLLGETFTVDQNGVPPVEENENTALDCTSANFDQTFCVEKKSSGRTIANNANSISFQRVKSEGNYNFKMENVPDLFDTIGSCQSSSASFYGLLNDIELANNDLLDADDQVINSFLLKECSESEFHIMEECTNMVHLLERNSSVYSNESGILEMKTPDLVSAGLNSTFSISRASTCIRHSITDTDELDALQPCQASTPTYCIPQVIEATDCQITSDNMPENLLPPCNVNCDTTCETAAKIVSNVNDIPSTVDKVFEIALTGNNNTKSSRIPKMGHTSRINQIIKPQMGPRSNTYVIATDPIQLQCHFQNICNGINTNDKVEQNCESIGDMVCEKSVLPNVTDITSCVEDHLIFSKINYDKNDNEVNTSKTRPISLVSTVSSVDAGMGDEAILSLDSPNAADSSEKRPLSFISATSSVDSGK